MFSFRSMARAYCRRQPSFRCYLACLLLVLITSGVSIVIYVLLEHSLPAHDGTSVLAQLRLKDSSLLQKIKQAVNTSSKNTHPSVLHLAPTGVKSNASDSEQSKTAIDVIMSQNQDQNNQQSFSASKTRANYKVHIFYYPWYGNPQTDGKYIHWNHRMLPHWNQEMALQWPQGVHVPPDDIGSNFYPALGPYSSADYTTVSTHMAQIQSTGAGVLVVSWYPPNQTDENGRPLDKLIPLILDAAHSHGLKVCLHIEPYKDRNAETLNQHVRYIIDSYGSHPGFYRTLLGGKELPVFYIYDSYQVPSIQWAKALKPSGPLSLRGTKYDGIFLGLYLSEESEREIIDAGFDGFYTYFVVDGFTQGSTRNRWKSIAKFAAREGLLFVPSIGPGYIDTRVRPWNEQNTRFRLRGKYFTKSFEAAMAAGVEYISVTSFNEWHEGTQIEPAVPKTINDFTYNDYRPGGPDFYLQLLKIFVDKFSQHG